MTAVSAGRIGKPHGRDGSFWLDAATADLAEGDEVQVASRVATVLRSEGTETRPLLRLTGLDDRESVASLRGEQLLVEATLAEGEWLAGELVGCSVEGMGEVARVLAGPTCDLLELDDGTLVPLVADAVSSVDVKGRRIEIRRDFLAG